MTAKITDKESKVASVSAPAQQDVAVLEQSFEMPQPQQRGVQLPRED